MFNFADASVGGACELCKNQISENYCSPCWQISSRELVAGHTWFVVFLVLLLLLRRQYKLADLLPDRSSCFYFNCLTKIFLASLVHFMQAKQLEFQLLHLPGVLKYFRWNIVAFLIYKGGSPSTILKLLLLKTSRC